MCVAIFKVPFPFSAPVRADVRPIGRSMTSRAKGMALGRYKAELDLGFAVPGVCLVRRDKEVGSDTRSRARVQGVRAFYSCVIEMVSGRFSDGNR